MAEEQTQSAQVPTTTDKRQWTIAVKDDAMAFKPRTWQEMADFAKLICATEFVPDAFRDKPGAVLAAWQTGHEVGLPPMASLRYIAVINGRPRIWGNGYWSLIKSHPLCEDTEELAEHEALEKGYGECTIKRRGSKKPVTARFTKEMAEKSGVWGGKGATQEKREQSPWFKRPGRMLQWMARNLAGNDAIPEAVIGLEITELAEELEPRDITPVAEKPISLPKPLKEKPDDPKVPDTVVSPATRGTTEPAEKANAEGKGPSENPPSNAEGKQAEKPKVGRPKKEKADGTKAVATDGPSANPEGSEVSQQGKTEGAEDAGDETSETPIADKLIAWIETATLEQLDSKDNEVYKNFRSIEEGRGPSVVKAFHARRKLLEKK